MRLIQLRPEINNPEWSHMLSGFLLFWSYQVRFLEISHRFVARNGTMQVALSP